MRTEKDTKHQARLAKKKTSQTSGGCSKEGPVPVALSLVERFEGRITMLSMLRCTRMTRTLATRSFRSTPAMFEKLPAQPDSFPAGELINEITGANGIRREEIEAQAQGLER